MKFPSPRVGAGLGKVVERPRAGGQVYHSVRPPAGGANQLSGLFVNPAVRRGVAHVSKHQKTHVQHVGTSLIRCRLHCLTLYQRQLPHEQALFEGAPSSSIKNPAEQGLLAHIAFLEQGAPFLVLLHAGKGSAPYEHLFLATRLDSNIRMHGLKWGLKVLTCDTLTTFQCSRVAPHECCLLISSWQT
jgi:hypothetical protein